MIATLDSTQTLQTHRKGVILLQCCRWCCCLTLQRSRHSVFFSIFLEVCFLPLLLSFLGRTFIHQFSNFFFFGVKCAYVFCFGMVCVVVLRHATASGHSCFLLLPSLMAPLRDLITCCSGEAKKGEEEWECEGQWQQSLPICTTTTSTSTHSVIIEISVPLAALRFQCRLLPRLLRVQTVCAMAKACGFVCFCCFVV